MAEATIPVDLRNPGQVFACLGLMEAAELLCGPAEGFFAYRGSETRADFALRVDGTRDPVTEVIAFLSTATASARAPAGGDLAVKETGVATRAAPDGVFPCPPPDKPATLPVLIEGPDGRSLPVEYWLDGPHVGRDNVKFWAGSGGYSGAALTRDALALVAGMGGNRLAEAAADPFAFAACQTSSFRFDWRRDYVPLEVGFSPNRHDSMAMVGYPLVELLSAVGLQHARPQRLNKLAYRYGVSPTPLPTMLARAVLGAQPLGFPMRSFRMVLGWPGQEGQARCILDAQEEL
ncbi:MAG: type I-U CRISPR-associated protein Cas8c [Alphaproteobacteria bacterium]|nr:type I-U CRISPR-associated protein Cas8c [Alphaproteobacteria bacterium]